MIDIQKAKEFIFKRNDDGTYHATIIQDIRDNNKEVEATFECPRIKFNSLDIEILRAGDIYWDVIIKEE